MNQTLMPWKILAATVGVGVLTEGWNLADFVSDSAEEARVFILDIAFAAAFDSVPVVHLGLTGFDMDDGASGRVSVKVAEISNVGFKVAITTWLDSKVYAVEFDWLAIGA